MRAHRYTPEYADLPLQHKYQNAAHKTYPNADSMFVVQQPDCSYVVPHKVAQAIPLICVGVDVRHAAAQTGLQLHGVPTEQVHDGGPRNAGKDWPCVVADCGAPRRIRHAREAVSRFDGHVCKGQHDAREHVDDNLLVDARDLPRA